MTKLAPARAPTALWRTNSFGVTRPARSAAKKVRPDPSLFIRKRQRTGAVQGASRIGTLRNMRQLLECGKPSAALDLAHSFGRRTQELHPLLPRNGEDESRKTSESCFPFQ